MNLKTLYGRKKSVLMVFLPLPLVAARVGAMFLASGNRPIFAAQCLMLVAVFLGPGLVLHPFIRRWLPPSTAARFICLALANIFITSFVLWCLYFLGLYTKPAALVFAATLAVSLLFGIVRFRWREAARSVLDGISGLTWPDKLGLAICMWFLTFSTLRSFEPFSTWDAIVSWDKWGRDMAARDGLGRYVMGAYPQLIPTLYSLFYKIFASPDPTTIPDATYFAHAANGIIDWLIIPGALVLCHRLGASLLLFAAFFFGSSVLIEWFASGYTDTATTALFLCTAALVLDWICDPAPCNWPSAVLRFVPAAATLCFAKGQGVLLTIFAAFFIFCRPLAGCSRKSASAIAALAAGFLLVVPYPIHQRHVWNSGHMDTDVRLHTMPVRIENPAVAVPTLSRASMFAREFAGSYKPPFAAAGPAYTAAVAILLAAAVLLSLRKRQMLPFALAAVLGWVVWFRLASYDWRNASQAAALTALCAAGGLRFGSTRSRSAGAAAVLECLVALAISGNAIAFMTAGPAKALPAFWQLAPGERPSALFGPRFDLLASSPLTSNARHLFTQNKDAWLLGDRSVYLWHPFASRISPLPGDVAAVFRGHLGGLEREYRDAFELVSGFQTQVIGFVQPGYEPVSSTIKSENLQMSAQPLPAGVSEPGTYWISSDISAAGGDVVLFNFNVAADDYASIRMVAGRDWNEVSSYRGICDFVREEDSFRVLFWLDRLPVGTRLDKLPPLALVKTDNTPITVKNASALVLGDSAPTKGDTL